MCKMVKKFLSLFLVMTFLVSLFLVNIMSAGATETEQNKLQYRYREKVYAGQPYQKNTTLESEAEWILYKTELYSEYTLREKGYRLDNYQLLSYTQLTYPEVQTYINAYSWDSNLVADYEHTSKGYVYNTSYDGNGTIYKFYEALKVSYKDSYGRTYYEYAGKKLYYQGSADFYNLSIYSEYYYHYYKWSDWSEWGDTPIEASEDVEVETRKANFNIKYDANGGSDVPSVQIKERDAEVTVSTDIPARIGYIFVGWSSTATGEVEYAPGDTYAENEDLTLYAVWEACAHYWDDGVITTEPTGTSEGVRTYTCSVCLETRKEKIDRLQVEYSFGQSVQLGLIEPWFLKVNLLVYTDSTLTPIDYGTLVDYGVYFVRASELEDKEVTQESLTIADIINNKNTVKRSKSEGTATIDGRFLSARYDEGLYTYEFDDSVFVLFYVEDEYGVQYAPIRERNIKSLLETRKDDVANFPELERKVYAAMLEMYENVTAYREDFFSKN